MRKNKHGLSRYIPADIERLLRQEAGFGCVICGNAIYEYEHIEPEWVDAKEHDPDRMTILCDSCHGNITRGLWSKQKAFEGKKNPKCKQNGSSEFALDIGTEPLIVQIGGIQFINTPSIIEIEGKKLLSIEKPEEPHSPPQISAQFFGRKGDRLATITNNCWEGFLDPFDIQTGGNSITVTSEKYKVDLHLELQHPNKVIIDRINMVYKKCEIIGNSKDGFIVKTPQAEMHLPFGFVKKVEKSSHGLSIINGDIQFGSDMPILVRCLNFVPKNPTLTIHSVKLKVWFAKDDPNSPPGVDENAISFRITNPDGHWTEWSGLSIEEITND